jgi:hypothetical protein
VVVKENLFRRLAPSLLLSILGGVLLHAIDRPAQLISNDAGNAPTISNTPTIESTPNNTNPNDAGNIPAPTSSKAPTQTPSPSTSSPNKIDPTPKPTKSKPKFTGSKEPKPNNNTATNPPTNLPTNKPTPNTTTNPAAFSGTVSGNSSNARNFGRLTTTVTFKDGKIENVSAIQSPSSWSQNSLPTLLDYVNTNKITLEQVKQIPSEKLPCSIYNSCRSEASYTANAFWISLKSAIEKAGL